MRGGAQSHLMRCSDGFYYVVKFQNNPQHLRVLANELLATRLAERLGLPVPVTEVVEVSRWLIEATPELQIITGGEHKHCASGLQFGSRYIADPVDGAWQVHDHLPEAQLARVHNLREFAGILCLDKWTCNSNGRQAVYTRAPRRRVYRANFIDQGYCFNAGEWNFPDSPLRGVYANNAVYEHVRGWNDFEPWLSRLESLTETELGTLASGIPPEWYGNWEDMDMLVKQLDRRRSSVRDFISAFRMSARHPFPRWGSARASEQPVVSTV